MTNTRDMYKNPFLLTHKLAVMEVFTHRCTIAILTVYP